MTTLLHNSQFADPAGPVGAHEAAGTAPATDHRPAHAAGRLPRLPRAAAFWIVGITAAALLAASSAASPLYPVYQVEFGFSAIVLTAIFAAYVLTLLIALLVVGQLSDVVGRRPVLGVALVVEAVSTVLFLDAHGTAWLFAARAVQGLATGAAIGVLGAYLLDLQPPDGSRLGSLVNSVAPTAGLSIGAVGAGVFVEYAPYPTRLVFVVLTALFVLLALAVLVLPETVVRQPGALASLRPRVAVPPAARRAFAAAIPTLMATWALGGLMLSVGGSIIAAVLAEPNHAVVGLLLAVFAGCGAVAALLARDLDPDAAAELGSGALLAGTVAFILSLAFESLPLFVIAAVVAGGGFGTAFLGALRSLTRLAAEHERAALLSAIYVVSYLAFSIPALVAGVLITHLGLREVSIGYGAFVGLLALARVTAALATSRRTRVAPVAD